MGGTARTPQRHRMLTASPLSLRLCYRLWTAVSLDVLPMEGSMTAFNAVRFRVKPGYDQEFLDAHKRVAIDWQGLRRVNIINPIESTFATVRHRTVHAKGCLSNKTALAMIFKLAEAAERSWRRLDGHQQMPKVILGVTFADGVEVVSREAQVAAA